MASQPTLVRTEEAQHFVDEINDPVTRNLTNMAYALVVKKCYLQGNASPQGEFDMLFFVEVLSEFFSEHEVIDRTLAGERVGAWFDEKK